MEDRLHLNDVIINDTASCNHGQSALREFRGEVLYASIDRRSVEAVVSFVFVFFYLHPWKVGGETQRVVTVVLGQKQQNVINCGGIVSFTPGEL